MNTSKKIIFIFLIVFANYRNTVAQKIDEGKVVFEINYPDADMPDEQMAMMPTESTMFFKGNESRIEMKMGMGMEQIMIFDNKNKTMTMLMDMMGNKIAVKMTEADLKKRKEKESKEEYETKITSDTKEIAGYKCKRAVVTGKDGSFDVYFTDQITYKNGDWVSDFKDIKGFPLQYKITNNNIEMQMTAKSVSKEKVDDTMFVIPEDYKEMTMEGLQKMYGGDQ